MAKLLLLSVFGAVLLAQLVLPSEGRDLAEVINNDIREQLKGYERFLEEDDGTHKDDLKKLIELTEGALTNDNVEEKQAIIKGLDKQFSPEFNAWISERLETFQVNDDIRETIEFYKSLIAGESMFKDEIESTISKLEAILAMENLKEKEEMFLNLDKSFTPEFQKFLRNNALPNVNRELQKTEEFLETLLREPDVKYEKEVKGLLEQTQKALGDLTVEEKQQMLHDITNPKPQELYEYLQKKFIELN